MAADTKTEGLKKKKKERLPSSFFHPFLMNFSRNVQGKSLHV